ncbi:TRPM8 channel-associated factor-like protein [Labeo rohita]|uniref:TRPM8 channel-associated factor-like protein n=1 Tax=Labeo rohita TaxID=84645 RepID=A0A498ND65_LABRO|nr:TRPM8 channel-associated factor-like protein [Labeo rohita]
MARKQDYYTIMYGLEELDLKMNAVPSDLVLIGEHAFPLLMNPRGQVLMAASHYGRGRVVVLGHEQYLTSFPGLIKNALKWLMPSTDDDGIVGIQKSLRSVAANLNDCPIKTELGDFRSGLAVYITDAYSVENCAKDLIAFIKAGGGLIMAGQAWHWAGTHPQENTLKNFPGNKVCSVAGIYFSKRYGEVGIFPVPKQIPYSWLALSIGKDFKDDLQILLEGVSEFDVQGASIASEVMVHGPLAFPIALTPAGKAFIAGAYYGQGRVILLSHECYVARNSLSTFLINAIKWLDEDRKGVIGILPSLKAAHTVLSKSGLDCQLTGFRKDLSVYVCTSYSDAQCAEIQEFVAEGGGLMIGGHAWYYAQTHRGHNVMTDYPGNHILNKMGLSLLGNTLTGGLYKAPEIEQNCKEGYHFCNMLHRFAEHVYLGKELTKSANQKTDFTAHWATDCGKYPSKMRSIKTERTAYTSMVAILSDIVKKLGVPQVSSNSPVKSAKDYLMLHIGSELYKCQVLPDPDALLPYIIKDRPKFPTVSNARVRISAKTQGETSVADWVDRICQAPAPWAELEFENIIMTLQSEFIRNLDRPDEVAKLWDTIMRSIADLAAKPGKFPRKERFVADVQISGGFMHSGYPIMMHTVSVPELVNVQEAYKNGLWGQIHELGHNQQRSVWEFPPHTTECTCNLWSVYVHEEVLGWNRSKVYPSLTPESRQAHIKSYCDGGKDLKNWSTCTALETYMQLQDKFGWDAFKKVFTIYHDMSGVPNNNAEKMNLYAETFSKVVKMNLCPFFEAWGWPIQPDTQKKISHLPEWSDHPMVQYA